MYHAQIPEIRMQKSQGWDGEGEEYYSVYHRPSERADHFLFSKNPEKLYTASFSKE